MNPFYVIGTTIGESDMLPSYAYALTEAEVIAAGARLMEQAEVYLTPYTKRLRLKKPFDDVLDILEEQYKAGRRVVVLAEGDPMFFGLGVHLSKRIPAENLRIIPGISSMQIVCARLAVPWHDVESLNMHGMSDWNSLAAAVMRGKNVCLLCDANNQPTHIARWLYERGADWLEMHIFTNLNSPAESCFSLPLAEAQTLSLAFPSSVVMLSPCEQGSQIKNVYGPLRRPYIGIASTLPQLPLYGRTVGMALLQILPGHTVWHTGTPCGILPLEFSTIAACVYACVPDKEQAEAVQKQRKHWAALNVEIVQAITKENLAELPAPNAVFYSAFPLPQDFEGFVKALYERLQTGGRFVAAFACLQEAAQAEAFLRILLPPEKHVEQLSLSDSVYAEGIPTEATHQGPVYLLAFTK